jgi:hypothetical protein
MAMKKAVPVLRPCARLDPSSAMAFSYADPSRVRASGISWAAPILSICHF